MDAKVVHLLDSPNSFADTHSYIWVNSVMKRVKGGQERVKGGKE